MLSFIGQAVQNPAKYEVHRPVSSHSEATVKQEIKIMQKISLGKVIKTAKDGIDIARRLDGYYNEIAQWSGLPQVPKPFTKAK